MAIPDNYELNYDKENKVKGGDGANFSPVPGHLDHTGTLEPSIVGRTKRPLSADVSHDLAKSTLLVPASMGP